MSFLSSEHSSEKREAQGTIHPKSIHALRKKVVLFFVLAFVCLGVVMLFFFSRKHSPEGEQILLPSQEEDEVTDSMEEQREEVPVSNPFPTDHDRDGISNEEEEALGLDQFEFDTDGDGISDLDEINIWQTDPTNVDTDNDGFADGYEIINGYSPVGEGTL